MKATLIIGIILAALGFFILVYFTSPVRFLTLAYVPRTVDVKAPIAGGLLLACGLAILFLSRIRKP